MARDMPKSPEDGMPDDPLMIRGDASVPFKYVQQVMQLCGEKGIQIWKTQLGASIPEKD